MRILYVEDNANDATLVRRYIETTPHELVIATNLSEAQAVLDPSIDLIMVDIMIGNQRGGYDFARDLRTQGYQQPLIAITALSTPQDLAQCEAAGFGPVLSKPFPITALANVISAHA
jgi:CheY-like chemotaxis protein